MTAAGGVPAAVNALQPLVRSMAAPIASALFAIVAIGWLVLLRPVGLGGPASYVVVSGTSMEPAIHTGDLVIVDRRDDYRRGDVIAFRAEGATILHRIVGGSTDEGFVVQGDNRAQPDLWRPRPREILGALRVQLPAMGQLAALARRPGSLGVLAGLTVFLLVAGVPTRPRHRVALADEP